MLKAQHPMNIHFLFVVAFVCIAVIGYFGADVVVKTMSYAEFAKSAIENLNAIDASNIIENCFSGEDGFIEWGFLTENENKNVCDIEACQICTLDIGLKIEDLETQKQWSFQFDDSKETGHEVFVNIRDGQEIHVGKIYVQIN